MGSLTALLPLILSSISGEEASVVIPFLETLLTNENARVKGPLTTAQIADTVSNLFALATAEQANLVTLLTTKTAVPAKPATAAK
jgi:hypothetical protein